MKNDHGESTRITRLLDKITITIGNWTAWLIALLILIILIQVVLRYLFSYNIIALEELQWHFYAIVVMVGVAYSYTQDSHIRLDLLHSRFSSISQEKIEIIGIVLLLWPMIFVFFMHSIPFVAESYRVGESSNAPTGLDYRWLIKSIIPVAFVLLFIASVSRLIRAIEYLKNRNKTNGR